MSRIKFTFQLFAAFGLTLILTVLAAAAPRVFVSTDGNDGNSCARKAPCRTFTAAVAAVDAGGEVVVLDSGGYGAVTITKSVQLVAPAGVNASITQTSGEAITIAAAANDTIVLRGLTLNGANNIGINFDSGAALLVENCNISNFFRGILFDAAGKLFVNETILQNNFVGILLGTTSGTPPSGAIQASINRTRVVNNTSLGVFVSPTSAARVSISDSVMSGNTSDGFLMSSGKVTIKRSEAANNGRHGFALESGATAELMLYECAASGNGGTGVLSSGGQGSVLRVSNSTVFDNAIGFGQIGSSVFLSFGNNRVKSNTNNTTGAIQPTGEI